MTWADDSTCGPMVNTELESVSCIGIKDSQVAEGDLQTAEEELQEETKSADCVGTKGSQVVEGDSQTDEEDITFITHVSAITKRIYANWPKLSDGQFSAKEWIKMAFEDPVATEALLNKKLPQKEKKNFLNKNA